MSNSQMKTPPSLTISCTIEFPQLNARAGCSKTKPLLQSCCHEHKNIVNCRCKMAIAQRDSRTCLDILNQFDAIKLENMVQGGDVIKT